MRLKVVAAEVAVEVAEDAADMAERSVMETVLAVMDKTRQDLGWS